MSLLNSVKKAGAMLGIAMVLVLAQGAWGATAAALATTINGYSSGTGNLSASASGNTVTVTGTKTGATASLTLDIDNGVTVNWTAQLTGSTSNGISSPLVNKAGAGFLVVQIGGKIEQTGAGYAIYVNNAGPLNISGGTVSATTGYAVYNNNTGKITVSGTSNVTSANTQGTIFLTSSGTETAVRLEITDGTVENTAVNGNAVYNESTGGVSISGSPKITGRIVKAGTGNLAVVSPFTPVATVTLDFPNYSGIAVAGGATFISKFAFASTTLNGFNVSLAISGNDLILSTTNGYTVTKNETTYTITKGVGIYPSVQAAIENIKTQAGGLACTIQFGYNTTALDIGGSGSTTLIIFDGASSGWGFITLTGKLTSASTTTADIIRLNNGASIDSKAELTVPSSGRMIYNSSTGTVNISGGTVSTTSIAIYNSSTGTVNISGGTVSTTGTAIYNSSTGTVNISGGTVSTATGTAVYSSGIGKITVSGTANVTSENITTTRGTIYLEVNGTSTTVVRLAITGGTVENTAANGNAVYNDSYGAVNISGGLVKATTGRAVYKNGSGTTTLTGGLLFAYGTAVSGVIYGTYTATSGNAAIVAWNNNTTTYTAFMNNNITVNSSTTARWFNKGSAAGIDYANGTNTGFIPLAVTVNKVNPAAFPTAAAITYGAALSTSALSGGTTGIGTFAWTTPATIPTVSNSGYSVTFTPTDANYNTLTQTVAITVNKANPAVTFPTAASITYGAALSISALSGGTGAGTFAWTTPATIPTVSNSGYSVTFTPTDAANYNTLTQTVAIMLIKAKVAIPTAATNLVYTGSESAGIAANAAYTITGGSATNAGSYTATIVLNDKANYEWANGATTDLTLSWTISKAAGTFKDTTAFNQTYTPTLKLSNLPLTANYAWADGTTSLSAGNGQSFTATYTDPSGNYNAATGTITVNVAKASYDITGISFLDAALTYNGSPHRIEISGTLPDGLSVSYANNEKIDVGTYTATATFATTNANYNVPEPMTATLTINNKTSYDMTGISFANKTVIYDDSPHRIEISGTLPSDVSVEYNGNEQTAAGEYVVTAIFAVKNPDMYNVPASKTATLTINKASYDMTGVSFPDAALTFNGSPQSIKISGTLPVGVTVSYTGNEKTAEGEHKVTATFATANANYNVPEPMTATLTINNKTSYDMTGISFANKTVTYDGSPHRIEISGTLPSGVSVKYIGNEQTVVGEYEVTAIFAVENPAQYNVPPSKTATLTINSEGSTPIRHPQIATGNLIVKTTASSIILENLPSNAKVEVYNLQGKQIYSAHPENPKILKIGVQTKGMYIVKTTFGSEKKMLRVVVR